LDAVVAFKVNVAGKFPNADNPVVRKSKDVLAEAPKPVVASVPLVRLLDKVQFRLAALLVAPYSAKVTACAGAAHRPAAAQQSIAARDVILMACALLCVIEPVAERRKPPFQIA